MKRKTEPQGYTDALSPGKKRLFILFALLLPFVLMIVLEGFLRLLNYGGDLHLVIRKTVRGHEVYAINQSVGRRYFVQAGSTIPQPVEGTFEIHKSKNTKRIFCLGESTMEGFPYELFGTAPAFLKDRLTTLLPQYNIEVINVGLSAIGTFVVQDFMDELLSYQPDLFIVYVGHNEFYGVYGVGSTLSLPGGSWLTRLDLLLVKVKTFLLLRDGYMWLHVQLGRKNPTPTQSLMGQMVGNQEILFHSELYERGRRIFRENLGRLIATAQSRKVPIVFSALVSNWRGQEPFVSNFAPTTSSEQQLLWREMVVRGDSSISHDNVGAAIQWYIKATQTDSMNASAFFKLGNALYAAGRYDESGKMLLRAKDLDALRFRASEEFQHDIIHTCEKYHAPIVRLDSAFMNGSPHGIVDNTLILEHLHPNIDGYFLMAKTLCSTIREHDILAHSTEWDSSKDETDSMYLDLSRVTEFDRAIGNVKTELLTRRWPFVTGKVNYEFVASNPEESVAFKMIKGEISWTDARYLLAQFYARNNRYDRARKECLAVNKAVPFSYEPLLRYAEYYSMEGNEEDAEKAYVSCFRVEDNPFARMKYAVRLLDEGHPAEAISQIDSALAIDATGRYHLQQREAAGARFLLGIAQARMGQSELAVESLHKALAIEPGYKDAQGLLDKLMAR
jgi:tetratricopeptide (TPR) repeat protein